MQPSPLAMNVNAAPRCFIVASGEASDPLPESPIPYPSSCAANSFRDTPGFADGRAIPYCPASTHT